MATALSIHEMREGGRTWVVRRVVVGAAGGIRRADTVHEFRSAHDAIKWAAAESDHTQEIITYHATGGPVEGWAVRTAAELRPGDVVIDGLDHDLEVVERTVRAVRSGRGGTMTVQLDDGVESVWPDASYQVRII